LTVADTCIYPSVGAYGITTRTIRNWKKKAGKNYRPDRWLLLAEGKKLHKQLIKARYWDKFCASIVLHGICPEHITDPEKERLWRTATPREFLHPAAHAAIRPENALDLVAAKLGLAGNDVNWQTVARELGVSVRTLYRHHGAEKVRAVCGISRHRKPMIESRGKLCDLTA
jgi:hypothetical protein